MTGVDLDWEEVMDAVLTHDLAREQKAWAELSDSEPIPYLLTDKTMRVFASDRRT